MADIYKVSQREKFKIFSKKYLSSNKNDRVSVAQLITDIVALKIFNKFSFSDYFVMGLYKKEYDKSFKKQIYGVNPYREFIDRLNSKENRIIVNHKLITKLMLEYHGVPVPRTIGVFKARDCECYDIDRDISSLEELISRCRKLSVGAAVIKPICDSKGGEGVKFLFIDEDPPQVDRVVREKYFICKDWDNSTFLNSIDDKREYLCEEYVVQHQEMAKLNKYSLNTVRMLCVKNGANISIIGAYLRVGEGTVPVDNVTAGGHVGQIDMLTGRIKSFVFRDLFYENYEKHALDGIVDFEVPYFDQIIKTAKKSAMVIYGLNFLALDIAVTEKGPVIIEINAFPSYNTQYLVGVGYKNLLK